MNSNKLQPLFTFSDKSIPLERVLFLRDTLKHRKLDDRTAQETITKEKNRHAEYVDNLIVMGLEKSSVDAEAAQAVSALESNGLKCHEVVEATADPEDSILGLRFVGSIGKICIDRRRMWKIRYAV